MLDEKKRGQSLFESFLTWEDFEFFMLVAALVDVTTAVLEIYFQVFVLLVLNFAGMTCLFILQYVRCLLYCPERG